MLQIVWGQDVTDLLQQVEDRRRLLPMFRPYFLVTINVPGALDQTVTVGLLINELKRLDESGYRIEGTIAYESRRRHKWLSSVIPLRSITDFAHFVGMYDTRERIGLLEPI